MVIEGEGRVCGSSYVFETRDEIQENVNWWQSIDTALFSVKLGYPPDRDLDRL